MRKKARETRQVGTARQQLMLAMTSCARPVVSRYPAARRRRRLALQWTLSAGVVVEEHGMAMCELSAAVTPVPVERRTVVSAG